MHSFGKTSMVTLKITKPQKLDMKHFTTFLPTVQLFVCDLNIKSHLNYIMIFIQAMARISKVKNHQLLLKRFFRWS